MKKIKAKIAIIMLAVILMALMIPTTVLGADTEFQVIKKSNGDYYIYIEGLTSQFTFAIAQKPDATDNELTSIISVQDKEGNQVAKITKGSDSYVNLEDDIADYLYVVVEGKRIIAGKKIETSEIFSQEKLEEVETTTKRIKTEVKTDIIEKEEEVNGVKIKVTVGGLEIKEDEKATYYYTSTKLPQGQYTTLRDLVNTINEQNNDTQVNLYTKIKTARQFYDLYKNLIEQQETEQKWVEVENMTIMQPNDAQKDEQYVVFIKKVDNNTKQETIDMKIMTSYREDEEEKIPGRTETKIVQETAKLPITGESIILFVILAIIVFVAIFIFVRMKKLEQKQGNK